jgi:hypothetical protein
MKRRRLVLSAFTVASCTPAASMTDAGVDAGYDAGIPDAGPDSGSDGGLDAGFDAGPTDAGRTDGGCACPRADGGCPVPPDFPPDASGTFFEQELCFCTENPVVFCYDETDARCSSWACNPGKAADGGLLYLPDGGVECLC